MGVSTTEERVTFWRLETPFLIRPPSVQRISAIIKTWIALKGKYHHFDDIFITGGTWSCHHFDKIQCSQWWKFHQNDNICDPRLQTWPVVFLEVYIDALMEDCGISSEYWQQRSNSLSYLRILFTWKKKTYKYEQSWCLLYHQQKLG